MSGKTSVHYDDNYFSRQALIGNFGGWADLSKFNKFISEDDDVLDFGCGGGYLLRNLQCHRKVGIESNKLAAEKAKQNAIEIYSNSKDVPDNYVDKIISNNALEHTLQPFDEIKTLYLKLRKGGKIVFVVPCESISKAYRADDINHHLYSWSPMSLGNLFTEAGYILIESKPYIHKWPPYYKTIAKLGGRTFFEITCRIYGRIERSWFQVRAIAEKYSK